MKIERKFCPKHGITEHEFDENLPAGHRYACLECKAAEKVLNWREQSPFFKDVNYYGSYEKEKKGGLQKWTR